MFNILSTVLLNGISIFTGPLFSRMLGTSGFGVLKIYNIWASVAAILLTLQTRALWSMPGWNIRRQNKSNTSPPSWPCLW